MQNNSAQLPATDRPDIPNPLLSLVFGKQAFGVNMPEVCEIVSVEKIEPVPDMPAFMRGVMPYEDKMIPVIDFRWAEGVSDEDAGGQTCVLVFACKKQFFGIVMQKACEELKEKVDAKPARKLYYWSECAGW